MLEKPLNAPQKICRGPYYPPKIFFTQICFFPFSLLPKLPKKVILVKKNKKKFERNFLVGLIFLWGAINRPKLTQKD